jgi:hypothetical protein
MSDEGRFYEFPPQAPDAVLLGLGPLQASVLLGTAVVAVGGVLVGVPVLPLLVFAGLGAALAWGRVAGDAVVEWLAVWLVSLWRRVRGQHRWMADVPWWEIEVGGDGEVPMEARPVELPPCLRGVELSEALAEELTAPGFGVVRDTRAGTASVLLRVSGVEFALLEPSEQDSVVGRWGDVLSSLCTERNPVVQVSWTATSAPSGLAEHRAWLARERESAEAVGEAAADAVASYELLVAEMGTATVDYEVTVAITVSANAVTLRRRPGLADPQVRLLQVLERAASGVASDLSDAGLSVEGPLGPGEVAEVLRSRVDPEGVRVRRQGRLLGERLGAVQPEAAGPMVLSETFGSLEIDGTHQAVYVVSEWPRSARRADWFGDVLDWPGTVDRTVTVLHVPEGLSMSLKRIERQLTGLAADEAVAADRGKRVNAFHRRAEAAAQQREEELVSGHGQMKVVGLCVISAAKDEELIDGCDLLERQCRTLGMDVRRLWGRQAAGWAAAAGIGVRIGNRGAML